MWDEIPEKINYNKMDSCLNWIVIITNMPNNLPFPVIV